MSISGAFWSVFLHAAAAVALLAIRLPVELPAPVTPGRVTLIASRLPLPPVKIRVRPSSTRPRTARAAPQSVREFRAPVALSVAVAAPRLAAPVELAIEIAPLPSPQLPRIAAGPPIRTGLLEESRVDTPPPAPRTVTRAGFGDGALHDEPLAVIARPAARTGGFGDASTAAAAPPQVHSNRTAIESAVEILSKPRPRYTPEARGMGIQGEVLLEVLFQASGDCQVRRLVHGLGHGLDESAAEAVREIRFRPARRDGRAVDSTAIVHISFELAF